MEPIAINTHIDCANNSKCSVRDILRGTKQGAFESVLVHFLLLHYLAIQATILSVISKAKTKKDEVKLKKIQEKIELQALQWEKMSNCEIDTALPVIWVLYGLCIKLVLKKLPYPRIYL